MAKVNITKPTGTVENLGLVSAFRADGNTYAIFDSEKTGSMGLPIIYVSRFNDGKLEKISDTNEWQNAKNYLKGIISGTNFEYIKLGDTLNADEVYYMPLTLPQASFDLIKSRYVVPDNTSGGEAAVMDTLGDVMPTENINGIDNISANTSSDSMQPSINVGPAMVQPVTDVKVASSNEVGLNGIPSAVSNASPQVTPAAEPNVAAVTPVMPSAPAVSNEVVSTTSVVPPSGNENKQATVNINSDVTLDVGARTVNNFDADKETFLKACENMFDALISKYQKQLTDLASREDALIKKEAELAAKSSSGTNNLTNLGRQVQTSQNNAQVGLDLNNLMPNNPNNNNQTGVI